MKNLLIFPIKFYKIFISPFLPRSCRFHPSCSQYCIQSITKYGAVIGSLLGLKRILRCNRFGGSGIDNVPDFRSNN